MNCVACGTALQPGAKFCGECGTPVAAGCRTCGAELAPGLKFCPECGTPTGAVATPSAQQAQAGPVAERRVTSVLFGDLVGFTALSESRDPEEVRELLGRYFDTAREIVARYGGTIEKFIGDAVMAVWGVPTAHEDDAERAVRAGIDLTESVSAFGESVGAPGLAMRVGIVTGEVAVTVGATGQGMVAGDAVNTASRVQAKADPGTVWVDEQTRALTRGAIDFADAGTHELKGKAEPIALFAVTAVMGGVGGERSGDRIQAPLVGRRREVSVLKEMFHVAEEERRSRLVVLSGDAGVGKTRLGWELENYIDGLSATVLWHRGRCLAYGDGVAFSALTAAVRGRIGVSDDAAESVVRDKLVASLEHYVPDETERARLQPAMISLLGLSGAPSGLTRPELFSAWLTWFERLSQREGDPVVWVVDDAHYADDGLLDFIEHVATVAQIPLLIVLLARAELLARRSNLAALRRATVIGLETLSRGDIASLLDGLVEGLPADVRNALVDRAEGNPLFAIETVRAMHDQGLTSGGPTRRPGAVRLATGVDAAALGALAAPASLQLLVASRLDLLPPRERSLLAAASVLGQTFSIAAARAVSGLSDAELDDALRELTGRDLLNVVTDRLSSEEGQFTFVQSVVRTVAYQTQSKRDRLERHLAAVAHLESLSDADSELNTVISQHLRDALGLMPTDDPQRADVVHRLRTWLERSADRSVAVGAPPDAVRALVEALDLTEDAADRIRLSIAVAYVATAAGDRDRAIAHTLPIATGEIPADEAQVAQAVFLASNALRLSSQVDEGLQLLQPYLDPQVVERLPTVDAAHIARQIGVYMHNLGRADDALLWTRRALRYAEDAGDPRDIALCLNVIGIHDWTRGHAAMGQAVLNLAVEVARKNQLVFELGMPLLNIAAFTINRDPGAAVTASEEAFALWEQGGNTAHAWNTVANQATALIHLGRWDELAVLSDRPLLQDLEPAAPEEALLNFMLAQVALARGDALDRPTLERLAANWQPGKLESIDDLLFVACGAALALDAGDKPTLVQLCKELVRIAYQGIGLEDDFPVSWIRALDWTIEVGDLDAARELLSYVADVPRTRLNPMLAAQLPRLRGTIEALDPNSAAGPDAIEQDLRDAIEALDGLGVAPDRARAQATLGRWLIGQGRRAEAEPQLAAARQTFTDLRANAWLRGLDDASPLSAAG
jgi:class 3 adenylate cyclase/tetratricopeptide (TPR) repeat protein